MSDDIVVNEAPMIFGGYVENASMSIGYGADSGTCQLTVVFEGDGPLRSRDYDSVFPNVGTACGFKFGECTFGGIFQRYTHKKSLDGYRYDVILESPGKWLDGIQIILDVFQGTRYSVNGPTDFITNQLDNVWNPFAVRENYEYGGIFGASNVNSAGFPALDALNLIQEISQGNYAFGGPAHFGDSYYEVDLSEVINITPSYFRLSGPVQSLASIIQECCDIAMHDYVVFIEPKNAALEESGVIDNPVIKVKVIDKSFNADSDFIKTIVDRYERQQKLISADHGREFPDIVTQRLVIGGAASRVHSSPPAFPLWGKVPGAYGESYLIGDGLEMNSTVPLYIKATGSQYTTDVLEIRCAMSGFNTWVLYHLLKNNTFPFFTNVGINEYQLNGLLNGTLTVAQILDNTAKTSDYLTKIYTGGNFMEFLNKTYDEIRQAGEEFYGRKFLVRLPSEPGGLANNIKFVSEDYQYITSWQISDSAFPARPPFRDLTFYDSEGRLKHCAVWRGDDRYDYSSMGSDWDRGLGGIATHKVNVEKDIFWFRGQPHAVIDVPPVAGYDEITTQQYGLFHLCKWFKGQAPDINIMSSFGAENGPLSYQISPRRVGPSEVLVAQESTRYTWGPWWWVSDKRGKAEVRVEDSLKPETFGGFRTLDEVGFAYANTAGAKINSVESGYIELAEIPNYNIAEKFAGAGPYVTGIDINIAIDGIKTTYKFNTWTPQFGKLAKYNADRLTRINKNYMRFMQDKRSRWTKPPLPSKDFKGVGVQSVPNIISPVWGMNSVNGVFCNLLQAGGQNMPNVAFSNITNALSTLSKNSNTSYGASMEQIISPITMKASNGTKTKATTTSPIPGKTDLNPYFPPTTGFYKFGSSKTDFQISVFNTKDSYDLQHPKNNKIEEVRTTAAMRGPQLLSGWGYTLDDKPIPASGTSRSFHPKAATDRSLWPSGPVHLLWDEEREVWTGGLHILEGELDSDVLPAISTYDPTTFYVKVFRKGWATFQERIACVNRDRNLSITLPYGYDQTTSNKIYAMIIRINYEWRPLYISCPE